MRIICVNKKANFNYFLIQKFTAGIALKGTEIKSIRQGKVNIHDAFCVFYSNTQLFIRQMHIAAYDHGNIYNHDVYRARQLLLTKKELNKLRGKLEEGVTIIPTSLFISDKNLVKIEIALARGKKLYDKRETIKKRDLERSLQHFDYEDL